jgi:hypothetical protein
MRLTFKAFDGRGVHHVDIVDQETGKKVGYIRSCGVGPDSSGGMYIALFGERYVGHVNRYEECKGFVQGVEVVLNHLTSTEFMHEPRGYELPYDSKAA